MVFFLIAFSSAALLYSVFGVAIEKIRGAEDDINTAAAGTLTGMLFKSGSRCLFCLHVRHYCAVLLILSLCVWMS